MNTPGEVEYLHVNCFYYFTEHAALEQSAVLIELGSLGVLVGLLDHNAVFVINRSLGSLHFIREKMEDSIPFGAMLLEN